MNQKDEILSIAINKKYIEITNTDSEEVILNKLITTLLYKSNRHGWDSEICKEIKSMIEILNDGCKNWNKYTYECYISQVETQNNTFYGSYSSEDSDSEEDASFGLCSIHEKQKKYNEADVYISRGQIEKISYQKKSGNNAKGDLKTIKNASTTFDINARNKIHYGEAVDQDKIENDLLLLNSQLIEKVPLEKAIRKLKEEDPSFTDFYVAQYRGITYLTTKWNQSSRKLHRKDNEQNRPQYSAAVLKTANISFFRNYPMAIAQIEEKREEMNYQAELLKEILLTLREPKPYSYKGYTYSNLGYLLQNIYTQDYDGFHHLIKTHPVLKCLLLNEDNPFFSMGDTPYHAEKYAHGIKPYKGHESYRLRPRWQSSGKAERPYSGVVYASLHPLTDFTDNGPLHVISLNRSAEIKLDQELEIVSERESCFPSYLPEGRIFYKHIAKYPSFKGNYKRIYYYKYGITETLYNKLKEKLRQARPHTDEMKDFKKLLGEWLCSYHEVRLIDIARQEAENRGGVLIYRDINGCFSLTPPIDSVNRHTKEMTAELKTPIKRKQVRRSSLSPAHKDPVIQPIFDENSINQIIDLTTILHIYDDESEPADIFTEGNNDLSIPFSLLLNAVREKRHLALQYFISKEIFSNTINDKCNMWRLENATLLHLAILQNDAKAVQILLSTPNIDINAIADETIHHESHGNVYYENITPLQLAVIYGNTEIISVLLNHSQINCNIMSSFVINKDLVHDLILEPNRGHDENGVSYSLDSSDELYDEDDLGTGWSCREPWPIRRTRNNNLLHLAAENNQIDFIETFCKKGIPINDENSNLDTPLKSALWNKHYAVAAKLINLGATIDIFLVKTILDKINFEFRYYIQYYPNSPLIEKIPKEIQLFLAALKEKKIDLLTNEESNIYIPDQGYFSEPSKYMPREIASKVFNTLDEETVSTAKLVCKSWHKIISDNVSIQKFENLENTEDEIEEFEIELKKKLKIS